MKKSILIQAVLLQAFFISAQAQTVAEGGEIELPDVTTVISGTTLTAGKDSVPDYSKILPDQNSGSASLPKFEGERKNDNLFDAYDTKAGREQSVYAEGSVGGGFPFYFTGDFSVYRTTGGSPFEINFFHENAEGFASKDAEEGYFYRNTGIDAKKNFVRESSEYSFSGFYKNDDRGFQLKSTSFTDYLKNDLGGQALASWKLAKGWKLSTKVDSSYYSRYGTTYQTAVSPANEFEKSAKIFSISPEFAFGWENSSFDLNFFAHYDSQLNMKDSKTLQKAPHALSEEAVHRGNFGMSFVWTDENVKLFADASLVVGNSTGKQSLLVPFTLGSQFDFKTPLSSRRVSFRGQGGMQSTLALASVLEESNPYSVLYCLPSEQSDWYGFVSASLPVKDVFDFELKGEFKKTAFDNGFWQTDYSDSTRLLPSGFYLLEQTERTDFNSEVTFKFNLNELRLSATWKAYWLDVPYIEEPHSLKGEVFYGSKDSSWELGASLKQFFGKDCETVPVLSGSASVKASPSIRLALEATDIIKLVLNKSRTFAKSQYAVDLAHVKVLVKFQF